MSLRISSSSCTGCQQWLLKSFLTATGISTSKVTRRAFSKGNCENYRRVSSADRIISFRSRLNRRLSSVSTQHASGVNNSAQDEDANPSTQALHSAEAELMNKEVDTDLPAQNDEVDHSQLLSSHSEISSAEKEAYLDIQDMEGSQETNTSTTPSFVPWYLQGNTEERAQVTAAGQEMPDLPEHAPQLLEPVVKHVLNTLGLSHLEVLDLRKLIDPPPALGTNLFMVIATARSERHLHASADKLCRWLRTEYKLTPFADGLLGRNEMKIAIRRRVRRAKMMSAVGAKSQDGEVTDGLRSDWICVNVGRVEGGMLPTDHINEKIKVVGFGTTTTGSTIVVQMLTESKREELDLEGLWKTALKRQVRKQELLINGTPSGREDEDHEEDEEGNLSVFHNHLNNTTKSETQRYSF